MLECFFLVGVLVRFFLNFTRSFKIPVKVLEFILEGDCIGVCVIFSSTDMELLLLRLGRAILFFSSHGKIGDVAVQSQGAMQQPPPFV